MKEDLENLVQETARLTHKLADTLVIPTLTDDDYEALALALEDLAKGVRRIPVIKNLLDE